MVLVTSELSTPFKMTSVGGWGTGRGCGVSFSPSGKAIQAKSSRIKSQDRSIQSPRQPATEELGILTRMMTSRHRFVNEFSQFNLVLLCKASFTTLPLLSNCYNASSPMKNQIMEWIKPKTSCTQRKSKGLPQPRSVPNTLCVQEDKYWQQNIASASWHHSQKHWL